MIKEYLFRQVKTYDQIKSTEGEYYDKFSTIIDHDADVWIECADGHREILFHFRKNVIPDEYLQQAIKTFKHDAKKASSIRGISGGHVDPRKISPNVIDVINPNSFKSRVVYSDGK